ncbi:MAG: peptidoglycan DD-metalloendopeptidase family protein [Tepidanaerobacteraceae bacterium]|jgi:murein DD-endopeptidase MepM/ murein hydrolase activator NlpD
MQLPSLKGFYLFKNFDLKNFDNKKKLIAVCCCVALCALIFAAVYSRSIYAISVDGKFIGNLKNLDTMERIQEELKDRFEDKNGADVEFVQNIEAIKVRAWGREVDTEEQLLAKLNEALSVRVKSIGLCINGQEVATVKDKETVEAVLDEVKGHYVSMHDGELLKIEVAESVKLVEKFSNPQSIMSPEEVKNMILKGTPKTEIYEVKKGDTLWSISKEQGVSLEELINANQQLKSEHKLAIGDEINLTATKPLLNVTVVKRVTYQETIPYKTEVVKDNSLWIWDEKVKQPGESGIREIVAQVAYTNGVKVDQKELDSKVLKEPVKKVVARGTKSQVAYRGSGRFSWPVIGTISSAYGKRGSEFHTGLDIAAKKGSPIMAANSGVVTFAGYRGGYGNLVIIDHGGGIQTYYAHANSISVSKGDSVNKGQKIATIGTTGRTTGPHVHFEVRINGSPTNPINYLNK